MDGNIVGRNCVEWRDVIVQSATLVVTEEKRGVFPVRTRNESIHNSGSQGCTRLYVVLRMFATLSRLDHRDGRQGSGSHIREELVQRNDMIVQLTRTLKFKEHGTRGFLGI